MLSRSPPTTRKRGEPPRVHLFLGGVGRSKVGRQPRIYFRRGGGFQTGADPLAVYIRELGSACALSRRRKMERVGVGLGKAHASLASGPENSPLLLFFCNLQAGKEEDSQASKSHPPPLCPLPALLVLNEEEQCVPLSCDIQKIEFYPKCLRASKQRVVSLS